MMNEPISGIMSTKLVTIDPEEPLTTVKELFSGKRIHHLPVVENGKLIGLITTADLLWLNMGFEQYHTCLLYTSPSPRDRTRSRMPSSA